MTGRLWTSETRVNTATTGAQLAASIAKLAGGEFVVVWQDDGVGGGDIKAQLYSAAGDKLGVELIIASGGVIQFAPKVVGLTTGGFRVVWDEGATSLQRYFDANGAPTGAAIAHAFAIETIESIAGPAGTAADVWRVTGGEIAISLYDAAGAPTAQVFVNNTTAGTQSNPDVARLSGGRYVAAWATDNLEMRARLIESSGVLVGSDFVLNSTPLGGAGNIRPSLAALRSSGFVASWHSSESGVVIRGRVFDAMGTPIGPDFLISSQVANLETFADLVALNTGGFMAVWHDVNAFVMRGAVFDARGVRIGAEFVISSVASNSNFVGNVPDVVSAAVMDDGRVAIVWSLNNGGLGDADAAVHLQIVDPRDGQVNGTSAADLLYGGQFEDQVIAFGGNDVVHGLGGDDVVFGGLGVDTVFGGLGGDALYGGDDNDVLNGGTGDDVAYGEAGNDTVFGELGDDLVFGQDGNDTLNGGNGHDAIYGQNGEDVTFGEGGDDAFFLGFGADTAFAGPGADVAYGEEGGDSLLGEAGDDFLDGGLGGDLLNGGAGVDNLIGGGDGDILIGGADGDRLEGGAGGDVYWYQTTIEGNDLIVGFVSADDQLQFTGSQFGGFTAGSSLSNGTTFVIGAGPTSALPTFYYNAGSLFFDPDGTGGAGAVFIALLQGAPALTAGDFQFV